MRSWIVAGLMILLLVMTSCSKPDVTCNKPYILVGKECCLDQNDNSICDKDEKISPPQLDSQIPTSPAQPSSSQPTSDIQESDDATADNDPIYSPSQNAASDSSGCSQIVYPENPGTGGMACHIRLVSPAPCQQVQFPVQFEWTTDGSYCETPYKLYITGDPPLQSIFSWSLSENIEQGITKSGGGFVTVTQEDLANAGVTSSSGVYHYVVQGYHGSNPSSQGFVAR